MENRLWAASEDGWKDLADAVASAPSPARKPIPVADGEPTRSAPGRGAMLVEPAPAVAPARAPALAQLERRLWLLASLLMALAVGVLGVLALVTWRVPRLAAPVAQVAPLDSTAPPKTVTTTHRRPSVASTSRATRVRGR